MSTNCVHLHVPHDALNLQATLDRLQAQVPAMDVIRDGDDYEAWGEPVRPNLPQHVVIAATPDAAVYLYSELGQAGVLVDATLADIWSASLDWGGKKYPGWSSRYPRH